VGGAFAERIARSDEGFNEFLTVYGCRLINAAPSGLRTLAGWTHAILRSCLPCFPTFFIRIEIRANYAHAL